MSKPAEHPDPEAALEALSPSQKKWDLRFLSHASQVSRWSKDTSTQVGACIVSDRVVVSSGFNGFPQGMPDVLSNYLDREEKYSRIVHGEMNALIFAARAVHGMTLYTVPFAPCDRCVVVMLQAGIKRFVFPELAKDKVERWGTAIQKTKAYIKECGATFTEYSTGSES
jgi:dCMP deaminase